MTDLDQLVPVLKLEVATPGEFAASYPQTSDDDLVLLMSNGFAQAQLEGFFQTYVLNADTAAVTPDLPPAGQALVVLYAADRLMTLRLLGLRQRVLYEAGPVKYEVENSAGLLTEMLRQLRDRKLQVIAAATGVGRAASSVYTRDAYWERAIWDGREAYPGQPADYFQQPPELR